MIPDNKMRTLWLDFPLFRGLTHRKQIKKNKKNGESHLAKHNDEMVKSNISYIN